eukprot:2964576-Prymnesium_polylepis.1
MQISQLYVSARDSRGMRAGERGAGRLCEILPRDFRSFIYVSLLIAQGLSPTRHATFLVRKCFRSVNVLSQFTEVSPGTRSLSRVHYRLPPRGSTTEYRQHTAPAACRLTRVLDQTKINSLHRAPRTATPAL